MANDDIDGALTDFILKHVDSIAQLEALLLLRRSPDDAWTVNAVAKRLYTKPELAEEALEHLCEQGLVECEDGIYRYITTTKRRDMVDRLAEVYARNLIGVTNLIHSKSSRIRSFAAAFKFKKDK